MKLTPKLTISGRFDSPENKDRIKMDLVQTAAMEYFELNKNNIELEKDLKLSTFQQTVYTSTFNIIQGEIDPASVMSEGYKRDLIRNFRQKLLNTKGIGVEKADQAAQILAEMLVVNG